MEDCESSPDELMEIPDQLPDQLPDLAKLPQATMLGGLHGKDKVSVMRRSVKMRKKPTRQGLRDSLFKSLEESDLEALSGENHGHIDEDDSGRMPVVKSTTRHNGIALPGISPLAVSPRPAPRDQKHMDLTNDLANMLKKRQPKSSQKMPDSAHKMNGSHYEETKNDRLKASEEQMPNDQQMKPVMPDVVPQISPRKIPDLPIISHKEDKPESMQISPDQKPEKSPLPMVYKKPELKPVIPNIKASTSSSDPQQDSSSAEASETVNAPWKPKLRKVERPAKAAKPDPPPALAPKPKLKPVTNRLSQAQLIPESSSTETITNNKPSLPHLESIDKSSLEEKTISPPKQESNSVSVSSLPQKSMVPPSDHSNNKPVRLKPMPSKKPSPPQENGEGGDSKPLVTLRAKPATARKPTVESGKPDWIKQAAEKRKRASLLIEQGSLQSKDESLKSVDVKSPEAELTSPPFRNQVSRTRRSSSIDSNCSDSIAQPAVIPAWKRELNKQNSRRMMDRYSKVDPIAEKSDTVQTDKENNDTVDEKVPVWKRELKRLSSRNSIVVPEEGTEESTKDSGVGPEPEFIKLFKKRQERLKKSASQISESDC